MKLSLLARLMPILFAPTWQVRPQIERTLGLAGSAARVCDVGAGGRRVRKDVVCVDVQSGPGVDVVADAHALPFPGGRFDVLICTGTLNLCAEPERVLSEFRRVVRPGGLLHLEVGLFQPYTPEPEDFWRYTPAGLRALAERSGFREERSGVHMGPFSAFTNNAVVLASSLIDGPGAGSKAMRGLMHLGVGWVKYADRLIPERTMDRLPFAYGIYWVGRAV